MSLDEILEQCPDNDTIKDNFVIAYNKINSPLYKSIVCSISGGADSDVMLDICVKCDNENKIKYVYFDTGLEFQATKNHIKYLENKYGIKIEVIKASEYGKPIPTCCKCYGEPFISKRVSEMISRLQSHNFDFIDKPFDELYQQYPNCKSALKWWCDNNGSESQISIIRNKWLKEFLIKYPPQFSISNKCCDYAKKKPAKKIKQIYDVDLNIVGVRKAEGGSRATAYKNCFSAYDDKADEYRPLFWYKDKDKIDYENTFNIIHSKCYTEYGLKRTGCVGCSYSQNLFYEISVTEKYEPKLYKAINNVFKNAYEYTRQYKEFCKEMDNVYGSYKKYLKEKK